MQEFHFKMWCGIFEIRGILEIFCHQGNLIFPWKKTLVFDMFKNCFCENFEQIKMPKSPIIRKAI
jgi:hypothetical protein